MRWSVFFNASSTWCYSLCCRCERIIPAPGACIHSMVGLCSYRRWNLHFHQQHIQILLKSTKVIKKIIYINPFSYGLHNNSIILSAFILKNFVCLFAFWFSTTDYFFRWLSNAWIVLTAKSSWFFFRVFVFMSLIRFILMQLIIQYIFGCCRKNPFEKLTLKVTANSYILD